MAKTKGRMAGSTMNPGVGIAGIAGRATARPSCFGLPPFAPRIAAYVAKLPPQDNGTKKQLGEMSTKYNQWFGLAEQTQIRTHALRSPKRSLNRLLTMFLQA